MMRGLDRLLVVVYVALAAIPVIAMLAGISGRELYGSLEPTPRPKLRFGSFVTEKYQQKLAAWFESNLGLKGTSIAIDNAIIYHVFRETKFGSTVRLGERGVLFPSEDLDFYNKHGRFVTDPAYVDQLVGRIASVQRRLRARGKALVPVLIPSKSTVWRDAIPDRWVMELPERHSEKTVPIVRAALDRHGIRYVDAVMLLTRPGVKRRTVFGPDARHWSPYGACLAMEQVATVYGELAGVPRLPHACRLEHVQRGYSHVDYDLFRLLNAMWVEPLQDKVPVPRHERPSVTGRKPRTLFVATSFGWTLMSDAHHSGLYGTLHLDYYNQTFAPWPEGEHTAVKAGTPEWRSIVMEKDLYVLDLFESYLGVPGTYVELFLTDLVSELDRAEH